MPAAQITEDRLLSAVALPMWFPPVRIDGDTYIDAVFGTDGNLEEMIRRGADELWVIWTVSTRGRWAPGFVAEYFLMIEAAANSGLRLALQRIEQNNADIAAGRPGAYRRPITVHLISADVPSATCSTSAGAALCAPWTWGSATHGPGAPGTASGPGRSARARSRRHRFRRHRSAGTSPAVPPVPLPHLTVPGPAGAPPGPLP